MGSLLCEHCASPINEKEAIVMKDGKNYHIDCHKCFICNEANLSNYESFRGVLFCDVCSKKIFDSCKKVHQTCTKKSRRGRREPKIGDRREFIRKRSKEMEELYEGTKELVRNFNNQIKLKNSVDTSKIPASHTRNHRMPQGDEKNSSIRERNSIDIGVSTYIDNEILDQLRTTTDKYRGDKLATYSCPKMMSAPVFVNDQDKYDLRIAGIGASTEIATMAFRNNKLNRTNTLSLTATAVDDSDSTMKTSKNWSHHRTAKTSMNGMEHTIGSIIMKPYTLFKTLILEESSIMEPRRRENRFRESIVFRRFKNFFKEEVNEHQARGMKKLYPTINRIGRPYKLGWLEAASRYSGSLRLNSSSRSSHSKRCQHYRTHSYRCMRSAVMRFAGPTSSQLKILRENLLYFVQPHRAFRHIFNMYCVKHSRSEGDIGSEGV